MATHSNHRGSLGICLLGCGTIGTGVVRILHEQRDLIAQRTGLNLELRHVVERDPAKTPTLRIFPFIPMPSGPSMIPRRTSSSS